MSIEEHCKSQQNIADRIFMDFKYTYPGSDEQVNALKTFHLLVALWADFLIKSDSSTLEGIAVKALV